MMKVTWIPVQEITNAKPLTSIWDVTWESM